MYDYLTMALFFSGGLFMFGWLIHRRNLKRRELSGFLTGADDVNTVVKKGRKSNSVNIFFSRAGYPDWGETHALLALVITAAVGWLIGLLITGSLYAAAGFILIGPFIFYSYLARTIEKNEFAMYRQMSDFCLRLANSIASGNSFEQAIASVAPKLDLPLRAPIKELARKISQGNIKTLDAVQEAEAYIPVTPYRMFLLAVRTHYRMGGDLAQSLNDITSQVDKSNKALESIRAYNSGAIGEGVFITVFPVVILMLERIFIPGYLMPLFNTALGLKMFFLATALILGGWILIRKISHIKVM